MNMALQFVNICRSYRQN